MVFPWRSDGACQVKSFNMLCGAMFWLLGRVRPSRSRRVDPGSPVTMSRSRPWGGYRGDGHGRECAGVSGIVGDHDGSARHGMVGNALGEPGERQNRLQGFPGGRAYEASALSSASIDTSETAVNSFASAADVPPSSRESEGREDCEARSAVESCCGG